MAQSKLNRAQLRAMEVRAAETLHHHPSAQTAAPIEGDDTAPTSVLPRRGAPVSRRATARPVALSKTQEYRFIRLDLRRLGMTAGALFVLMIVLLVVVD